MKRSAEAFDDESDLIEPPENCTKIVDLPDSSDEVLELRQKVPKFKKEYQPDSSDEVLELRQKNAKLKKDYQIVSRLANEYESRMNEYRERAEFLKNLIDNEPAVDEYKRVDELQKKLTETWFNLDKTTHEWNNSNRKNGELQLQVNELKRENEELHKANLVQAAQHLEDARKNTWEQLQLGAEIKFKSEEIKRANEMRKRDQQKINELTGQLAEREEKMVEMRELHQQQRRKHPKMETVRSPLVADIFSVVPWEDSESILYNKAERILRFAYYPHNEAWLGEFDRLVRDEILACEICAKPAEIFIGAKIIEHFFSEEHADKLRLHFGALSIAAAEYWLDKLQQIPRPPPPSRLRLDPLPVTAEPQQKEKMPKLFPQKLPKIVLTKVSKSPKVIITPRVMMLDDDIPD